MILNHVFKAEPGRWQPTGAILADMDLISARIGKSDWPVDVAWVDDREMTDLNRRYRDKNDVTDILSFGNLELSGQGQPAIRRAEAFSCIDLYRDEIEDHVQAAVGELVIAPWFVHLRCLENGWDYSSELRLLIAHGLLHLLGWDHEEEPQASQMRGYEVEILGGLGFQHPLTIERDRKERKSWNGDDSR